MIEVIHHETTGSETGPVQALARRISYHLDNGGHDDSLLCDYRDETGDWLPIEPKDMINAVRQAVHTLKLHEAGIDPDLVGVHSLRDGGAMALQLHGVDATIIMKHLSADLSSLMSIPLPFLNIANME